MSPGRATLTWTPSDAWLMALCHRITVVTIEGAAVRLRRRPIHPSHATPAEAIHFLASVCDGALRRDGIGFGTDHVAIGHHLAAKYADGWAPHDHAQARHLLRIYRRQLLAAGFDIQNLIRGRRPRRCSPRTTEGLVAGWAADPFGFDNWRYWNGARWTHQLAAQIPLESYEFVTTT